ncbi:unnamed protein product [Heterobilharzia americana]|nr:unnamed protein product [Heterobilharzia americana]
MPLGGNFQNVNAPLNFCYKLPIHLFFLFLKSLLIQWTTFSHGGKPARAVHSRHYLVSLEMEIQAIHQNLHWEPNNIQNANYTSDEDDFESGNSTAKLYERSRIKALADEREVVQKKLSQNG